MTDPRTMSEDTLKAACIDLAEALGWLVFSIRRSDLAKVQGRKKTGAGFPDLILLRRGVLLAVELKREDGKTTWQQHRWLGALANAGVRTDTWRPRHWLDGTIERVLRGKEERA